MPPTFVRMSEIRSNNIVGSLNRQSVPAAFMSVDNPRAGINFEQSSIILPASVKMSEILFDDPIEEPLLHRQNETAVLQSVDNNPSASSSFEDDTIKLPVSVEVSEIPVNDTIEQLYLQSATGTFEPVDDSPRAVIKFEEPGVILPASVGMSGILFNDLIGESSCHPRSVTATLKPVNNPSASFRIEDHTAASGEISEIPVSGTIEQPNRQSTEDTFRPLDNPRARINFEEPTITLPASVEMSNIYLNDNPEEPYYQNATATYEFVENQSPISNFGEPISIFSPSTKLSEIRLNDTIEEPHRRRQSVIAAVEPVRNPTAGTSFKDHTINLPPSVEISDIPLDGTVEESSARRRSVAAAFKSVNNPRASYSFEDNTTGLPSSVRMSEIPFNDTIEDPHHSKQCVTAMFESVDNPSATTGFEEPIVIFPTSLCRSSGPSGELSLIEHGEGMAEKDRTRFDSFHARAISDGEIFPGHEAITNFENIIRSRAELVVALDKVGLATRDPIGGVVLVAQPTHVGVLSRLQGLELGSNDKKGFPESQYRNLGVTQGGSPHVSMTENDAQDDEPEVYYDLKKRYHEHAPTDRSEPSKGDTHQTGAREVL